MELLWLLDHSTSFCHTKSIAFGFTFVEVGQGTKEKKGLQGLRTDEFHGEQRNFVVSGYVFVCLIYFWLVLMIFFLLFSNCEHLEGC